VHGQQVVLLPDSMLPICASAAGTVAAGRHPWRYPDRDGPGYGPGWSIQAGDHLPPTPTSATELRRCGGHEGPLAPH
jgi:hypothetical protein